MRVWGAPAGTAADGGDAARGGGGGGARGGGTGAQAAWMAPARARPSAGARDGEWGAGTAAGQQENTGAAAMEGVAAPRLAAPGPPGGDAPARAPATAVVRRGGDEPRVAAAVPRGAPAGGGQRAATAAPGGGTGRGPVTASKTGEDTSGLVATVAPVPSP